MIFIIVGQVTLYFPISQHLLKIGINNLEQQAYICEVLQTKRGSIPLGMSLLVCGPAWA